MGQPKGKVGVLCIVPSSILWPVQDPGAHPGCHRHSGEAAVLIEAQRSVSLDRVIRHLGNHKGGPRLFRPGPCRGGVERCEVKGL